MTSAPQVTRPRRVLGSVSPRLLRDVHLYVGVLFAPTILFFATTGAIQVLGLHEANRESGYKPAAMIEKLSEVHIHQRFAAPPRKPAPRSAAPISTAPPVYRKSPFAPKRTSLGTTLAKWFFALAATGLTLSTLLGLWIALRRSPRGGLAWALLAAGAVIPVLMILL